MAASQFPNNLQAYGTKCYISLIAPESSGVAIKRKREGCFWDGGDSTGSAVELRPVNSLCQRYELIRVVQRLGLFSPHKLGTSKALKSNCAFIINYYVCHWQHRSLLQHTGPLPCWRTWQQRVWYLLLAYLKNACLPGAAMRFLCVWMRCNDLLLWLISQVWVY